MEIVIKESYESMSKAAARAVAQTINAKPNAVLGLATGSTPLSLYVELVRMHREEGLDFSQVTTFNLDEYGAHARQSAELSLFHATQSVSAHQHRSAEHLHSVRNDG